MMKWMMSCLGLVMVVWVGRDLPAREPHDGPGGEYTAMEHRIDELIRKMTIEEKASEINEGGFGPYQETIASPYGLGHVVAQQLGGVGALEAAERANNLQKLALQHSRLKIPLIIVGDCAYDARVSEATNFPQ